MKVVVALSISVLGLSVACREYPSTQGRTSTNSSEQQRTERWTAEYDRQLRETSEQLRKAAQQDVRFDAILDKWEEQGRRMDAILDRWERILAAIEQRSTEPPNSGADAASDPE